mmetsp:Transcript_12292/g.23564  ORF Transcript_12292/g.23564 Transcript_12292/m.23564 type:complete len:357 (-) Transcript_12292:2399-3469(-)
MPTMSVKQLASHAPVANSALPLAWLSASLVQWAPSQQPPAPLGATLVVKVATSHLRGKACAKSARPASFRPTREVPSVYRVQREPPLAPTPPAASPAKKGSTPALSPVPAPTAQSAATETVPAPLSANSAPQGSTRTKLAAPLACSARPPSTAAAGRRIALCVGVVPSKTSMEEKNAWHVPQARLATARVLQLVVRAAVAPTQTRMGSSLACCATQGRNRTGSMLPIVSCAREAVCLTKRVRVARTVPLASRPAQTAPAVYVQKGLSTITISAMCAPWVLIARKRATTSTCCASRLAGGGPTPAACSFRGVLCPATAKEGEVQDSARTRGVALCAWCAITTRDQPQSCPSVKNAQK